MKLLVILLVAIISAMHLYFLILEMFFWTKPLGLKAFKLSLEQAKSSAALAANQGLYNGFLSAGLLWSVIQNNELFAIQLKIFFLVCVIIAGIYGGFSVSKKIFFIQAGPAIIALAAVILSS